MEYQQSVISLSLCYGGFALFFNIWVVGLCLQPRTNSLSEENYSQFLFLLYHELSLMHFAKLINHIQELISCCVPQAGHLISIHRRINYRTDCSFRDWFDGGLTFFPFFKKKISWTFGSQ